MIIMSLIAASVSVADLLGATHIGSPKGSVPVWLGVAALSAFLWDLLATTAKDRLSTLDARPKEPEASRGQDAASH